MRFADALDAESFRKLAEDVEEIDFEQLSQIVQLSLAPASSSAPSQPIPLPPTSMLKSRDLSSAKRSELFASGVSLIAQSRVALVILAGGQGTRLGTEDPKGCYDIGLPSHTPLFELQVARTLKLSALAGAGCVPVYVMTSPMTHAATVKFFEDKAFFGCDRWGEWGWKGMDVMVVMVVVVVEMMMMMMMMMVMMLMMMVMMMMTMMMTMMTMTMMLNASSAIYTTPTQAQRDVLSARCV